MTAKDRLKKVCFGIRGPQCTVTDSNGEVIAELLPNKFYANNLEDVRKARVNEKAVNPDMKFLV